MTKHWENYTASNPYSSDRWATSDRGWLFRQDGTAVGHYLDYGPDHYRSPHEYCGNACRCRESQPGNIHAVRFGRNPRNPSDAGGHESRYFVTIAEAKAWIEEGGAR